MSAAQDVVGVFDSGLTQLFVGARPIKATVKPTAKLMEHPIEDGASITDHRVFQPIEIELSMVLTPETFMDTHKEIVAAFGSKTPMSVQTKADTYSNMYITEIPHDEEPDVYDTISVALKLREAQIVTAQYAALPPSKVKKKANSSTTKTGQKNSSDASTKQGSALHDLIFGGGR